jgi:hypothetical protein
MERMKRRPSVLNPRNLSSVSPMSIGGTTRIAARPIEINEALVLTGILKNSRTWTLKINIRANPKIPSKTKARIEFRYLTSEKIESGKT